MYRVTTPTAIPIPKDHPEAISFPWTDDKGEKHRITLIPGSRFSYTVEEGANGDEEPYFSQTKVFIQYVPATADKPAHLTRETIVSSQGIDGGHDYTMYHEWNPQEGSWTKV